MLTAVLFAGASLIPRWPNHLPLRLEKLELKACGSRSIVSCDVDRIKDTSLQLDRGPTDKGRQSAKAVATNSACEFYVFCFLGLSPTHCQRPSKHKRLFGYGR